MKLEELRSQIDTMNRQLIELIGRRTRVAREIAGIKKGRKLPVLDKGREEKIKEEVRQLARAENLSPAIMEEIFDLLLDYTRLEMELQMNPALKDGECRFGPSFELGPNIGFELPGPRGPWRNVRGTFRNGGGSCFEDLMKTRIGIIGQGLMGGSIFKGIEESFFCKEDDDFSEVDLLILAVPIPAILEIGKKIALKRRASPLLIIDIGSVKEEIAKKFEQWTDGNVEFIATHPMAGKEKSGYEHSDPAIFQDAAWVTTPHAKNTEASLQIAEDLIRHLGARPMRMDAAEHDRRAALVSHLPYLISKALFDFVDPEAKAMAGPGFSSMIRLAGDNPDMRKEIGRCNRENIDHFLKGYIKALQNLLGEGEAQRLPEDLTSSGLL